MVVSAAVIFNADPVAALDNHPYTGQVAAAIQQTPEPEGELGPAVVQERGQPQTERQPEPLPELAQTGRNLPLVLVIVVAVSLLTLGGAAVFTSRR